MEVLVIALCCVLDEFTAKDTLHYIQTFDLYINQFYPQVNALLLATMADSIPVTWRDHRPAAEGTDSELRMPRGRHAGTCRRVGECPARGAGMGRDKWPGLASAHESAARLNPVARPGGRAFPFETVILRDGTLHELEA